MHPTVLLLLFFLVYYTLCWADVSHSLMFARPRMLTALYAVEVLPHDTRCPDNSHEIMLAGV